MGSENFGVKPLDHSKGPVMVPISEGMKGHVGDNVKRGAAPPLGGDGDKYSKQAMPDHGKHGKRGG